MKVISGLEELDSFIIENINNDKVTLLYFGATCNWNAAMIKGGLEKKNFSNFIASSLILSFNIQPDHIIIH